MDRILCIQISQREEFWITIVKILHFLSYYCRNVSFVYMLQNGLAVWAKTWRSNSKIYSVMIKNYPSSLPHNVEHYFEFPTHSYSKRKVQEGNFHVSRTKLTITQHNIKYAVAKHWNSLLASMNWQLDKLLSQTWRNIC